MHLQITLMTISLDNTLLFDQIATKTTRRTCSSRTGTRCWRGCWRTRSAATPRPSWSQRSVTPTTTYTLHLVTVHCYITSSCVCMAVFRFEGWDMALIHRVQRNNIRVLRNGNAWGGIMGETVYSVMSMVLVTSIGDGYRFPSGGPSACLPF